MKLTLSKDKVTPGTVRFHEDNNDDHPIVIYLTKERVKELGNPESLNVDITKKSQYDVLAKTKMPTYNNENTRKEVNVPKPKSTEDEEFVPTEEQVLRELKQQEQRKAYMKSPKAIANRKAYQQRKQQQAKQMRQYLKTHPEVAEKIKAEHPELTS